MAGGGTGQRRALLAWQAAQQAAQQGGEIVVLDRRREVYPPALAAWGVALERVIFVQPENARDEGWAWDQALRCPGVAAVWGWVERVDDSLFRRWQLSAEASGCLGLLLRPGAARTGPTWADVRWWVEPQSAAADRRLRVELLRCRHAGSGSVELVLDEWSGQLCDPAPKGAWLRSGRSVPVPIFRVRPSFRATPNRRSGMSRILALWLPNWPVQRLVRDQPELTGRAIVLYEQDARHGQRVKACSAAAEQQAVRPGMPLAEAQTLLAEGKRVPCVPFSPATMRAAIRKRWWNWPSGASSSVPSSDSIKPTNRTRC